MYRPQSVTRPRHALRIRLATAVLTVCLLGSALARAQGEARISELTYVDKQYMQEQRELTDDLVQRNFGRRIKTDTVNDLELLQMLHDSRVVSPEQTRELQAMGIVLGDLLAADLDMHWVIYEDRLGRSRALRYRESDNYLFPATMISRRREAGNSTSVQAIYDKAYNIIDPLRQPLPFQ